MSLNKCIQQGRIPFDMELKGDEGKEYMGFSVSVKRNYKPEGEQYYPEDLLFCKVFKAKAKFISQYFKKGDDIIIEGELRRDDDYTPEGATEPVRGQMYVLVTDAYFAGGAKKSTDDSGEEKKSTPAKSAAKAPTKAATPSLNPLASGAKKKVF